MMPNLDVKPKVGDFSEDVVVDNLSRTQIVQYAGLAGDTNPHHSDEVFATQAAGFPTVFAMGMLTMAMSGKVISDWFGSDRLLSFSARFVSQVWPGDTLVARAEITEIETVGERVEAVVSLKTTNESESVVLTGSAHVILEGELIPRA
jgi:acyl dehydratase